LYDGTHHQSHVNSIIKLVRTADQQEDLGMSNEIQKQATEGATFRIPSSSINQLREESKKETSKS
jgi:hypothetical protein